MKRTPLGLDEPASVAYPRSTRGTNCAEEIFFDCCTSNARNIITILKYQYRIAR